MNVTKYSSFTDIVKNIFTNPKKITHFFPRLEKKKQNTFQYQKGQ